MSFSLAEKDARRDAPIRQPASQEIVKRLLDVLLSGDVAPGSRIPSERQLAEDLKVGRAMIREAIKSLGLLGLLEQRVGDGTYLSKSSSDLLPQVIEWGLLLGEKRFEDLLESRFILEVQLAGIAATRRTPEQLATIQALAETMRLAEDDIDAYVQTDIAFHLEIARASHNTVLCGVLGNIRSLLQAWTSRVLKAAGETRTSFAVHEPILRAIEASDPDAAAAAMTAHMERATRRLRASFRV